MAFREVNVNEVKEVLRIWLGVPGSRPPGLRTIAAHCGVDRKTARRYIEAAQAAGLQRGDGVDALDDGLIGAVIEAVCPPGGLPCGTVCRRTVTITFISPPPVSARMEPW